MTLLMGWLSMFPQAQEQGVMDFLFDDVEEREVAPTSQASSGGGVTMMEPEEPGSGKQGKPLEPTGEEGSGSGVVALEEPILPPKVKLTQPS